jgi:hypothetical protein
MTDPMLNTDRDAVAATKTVDQELVAIQAVLSAFSGLNAEARQRVIDYVFQRLGLSSAANTASSTTLPPVAPPVPSTNPSLPTIRDIRSLKEQKKPRTAVDMAALVAYYLSELAPDGSRKAEIGSDDITTFFKQAGFPLPAAPRQTLFNAKAAGYLDAAAHGAYKLNPVGHNLVAHGLPSAGTDSTPKPRGKRGAKKTSKRAKDRKKR